MSAADAVTVNEKTQTAVEDAVQELGEGAVGAPVLETARALGEAARPLSPADHQGRKRGEKASPAKAGGADPARGLENHLNRRVKQKFPLLNKGG